ncbi:MAG: OsmC family protein [Bacteroidia bacterium]
MTREELRTLQAPLKKMYLDNPEAAMYILRAEACLQNNVSCQIISNKVTLAAGLHPATGGKGDHTCSGNLLLESLVACAGVTLLAVATSAGFDIQGGIIKAEGDLDFRGTLGNKEVPVGFQSIRLFFELETKESDERVAKLIELAERYCVVYQTLKSSTALETAYNKIN